MAETKTKPTDVSVVQFLAGVDDPRRRADSNTLVELMSRVTGEKPKMWGPSIVGFGSYHYKYESGREGDATLVGFSPRASEFAIYLSPQTPGLDEMLGRLGKHKMGKSCLSVKRVEDVDLKVLEELVLSSATWIKERYPD